MDLLSTLVHLNYRLYRRTAWYNFIYSPGRNMMRLLSKWVLPRYLKSEKLFLNKKYEDESLIVSLTSFPARIAQVWLVIRCLLRQSVCPTKIILWLSKDQFPGELKDLPVSLTSLMNEVFEIRFVEGDIRSHKKYYYVCQEYPDSLILLVDDDIYYPAEMCERILNAHKENPDAVICQYGYLINYDRNGSRKPYVDWTPAVGNITNSNLFFGSGGGTLFLPSRMYKDFLSKDLFLRFTPIADDIWINAMVRLSNQPIRMIKAGLVLPTETDSSPKLASENMWNNRNDQQIDAVSKYYLSLKSVDPFEKRE